MKKKEKLTPDMHIVMMALLCAVIILIGIVIFMYVRDGRKFNENEDICELTCQEVYEDYYHRIFIKEYRRWNRVCEYKEGDFNDWGWTYNKNKCYKYRPKTKCELCVDNWDESCDEFCECYEYELEKCEENWKDFSEDKNWCCGKGTYNSTWCYKRKEICLKAHPKLTCKPTEEIKCQIMSDNYAMDKKDRRWCGGYKIQKYKAVCEERPKPIKINLEKEKCVEHSNEILLSTKIKYDFDLSASTNCDVVQERLEFTPDENIRNFKGDKIMKLQIFYDQYCCLKKQELNPCERGDEDWIIDDSFCGVCCGEHTIILDEEGNSVRVDIDYENRNYTYGCYIDGKFRNIEEKICRKKNLKDYNCPELWNKYMDAFWVRNTYLREYIDRCGGKNG